MQSKKTILDRPNVLVVGGAGFVGANFCEFLLQRYNVICVDNYSTGSERVIDTLLSHPHFEVIRHDINEPLDFADVSQLERFRIAFVGVQFVVMCVGTSAPKLYTHDPVGTLSVAARGTKNVLDFALHHHAKVLFVSDARIYGSAITAEPLSENALGALDHLAAHNMYVEGKRYGESLVSAYQQAYHLPVSIVRLGSVYGPRMRGDDGRCISTLIARALAQQDMFIPTAFTHGSFISVDDMCDAFEKILLGEKNGVYNLCHTTRFSLSEVADSIVKLTGSQSKMVHEGGKDSDGALAALWQEEARPLSISKIKDELGWFPVVLLQDGLSLAVNYMKAQRGAL